MAIDLQECQNYRRHKKKNGLVVMRLERSTTRTFRFGLAAVAALTFSIALAIGSTFTARAQDDAPANAVDAQSDADQPAQSGTDDSEQKAQPDAAQQAHDAADAAQEVLDNATQARDQLESDGASQDQIDAANAAIAQARADKDSADAAAVAADEAAGQ